MSKFNKEDVVSAIATKLETTKIKAETHLDAFIQVIADGVDQGAERIAIPGLGIFTVKERAARKGRNPRTGEELDIPAKKNLTFKASKAITELLD